MIAIYTLRDAAGLPQYVGITGNPEQRRKAHEQQRPELQFELLLTRLAPALARELERELIARLKPAGLASINRIRAGRLPASP